MDQEEQKQKVKTALGKMIVAARELVEAEEKFQRSKTDKSLDEQQDNQSLGGRVLV